MSEGSKIEWTEHTFNPWWGCSKKSDGCKNCYAEGISNRHTKRLFGHESVWGIHNTRGFFPLKNIEKPYRWNRKAKKAGRRDRVFCASMADVFERHPDPTINRYLNNERANLWTAIEDTTNLIWILLTKRPENIVEMVPANWNRYQYPDNLCLMTSCEDQQRANERIPVLLSVPAKYHGLSCEPLLGPIDLREAKSFDCSEILDWVIVGGESGHGARPMHPGWARDLRDQCNDNDIPFFFKQWGDWLPWEHDAQPPFMNSQNGRFEDAHGLLPDVPVMDWPKNWHDGIDYTEHGDVCWQKVGKKKAGRLLDGRFWDEHPFLFENWR